MDSKRIMNQYIFYLKKMGLRNTKERQEILFVILKMETHFDADSLYFRLREEGMKVSRATVYRTLDVLCESGILTRMFNEDRAVYEVIFGRRHHDHIECIGCGSVIEFQSEEIEKLQIDICNKFKYKLSHHSLKLWGYCDKCKIKFDESG